MRQMRGGFKFESSKVDPCPLSITTEMGGLTDEEKVERDDVRGCGLRVTVEVGHPQTARDVLPPSPAAN